MREDWNRPGRARPAWHHPRVMLRDTFASSAISACFDDASLVAAMLAFERALARAEARAGVIRQPAAGGIDAGAALATFDVDALATDARRAGTLAIPFVKSLTAAVAAHDADAARYVHWGATSQDVLDTALALQVREATKRIVAMLDRLGDAVATLAAAHRATVMAARTLLQPATPVPVGWKAAVWLDALARARRAFAYAAAEAAVLQFGGASGVRASLGAAGDDVARALADELGLGLPAVPWHGVRDRIARGGSELGIVCGVASKIAGDVMLMMQPEVGEAFEPSGAGRGGSSALPHKRNPVGSMLAREAALRAPQLVATLHAGIAGEHERGLGQWQGQFWTLGELFGAAGSALEAMAEVVEGLRVDAAAMRRNVDAPHGFVYAEALSMALAAKLGKAQAHARIEALCERALSGGTTLREALERDAELAQRVSPAERDRLFDPASQFGSANAMIDRALDAWRNRST